MNLRDFDSLDPQLLPGLFNTALRNEHSDLDDLILTHDLDRREVTSKLESLGYRYDDETNQFRFRSSEE